MKIINSFYEPLCRVECSALDDDYIDFSLVKNDNDVLMLNFSFMSPEARSSFLVRANRAFQLYRIKMKSREIIRDIIVSSYELNELYNTLKEELIKNEILTEQDIEISSNESNENINKNKTIDDEEIYYEYNGFYLTEIKGYDMFSISIKRNIKRRTILESIIKSYSTLYDEFVFLDKKEAIKFLKALKLIKGK